MIYGYIRTSTDDQKISLSLQEDKIRTYCDLNDLGECEIIRDQKSGKNLKREGITGLLGKLQEGDSVIVYKLDRLSRSTRDTLNLIENFEKRDIAFHSINENLDTQSAIGKFVLTIISAIASLERGLISERTRDALQELKSNGKAYSGQVPYGFTRRGDDLAINKEEQKVIRQMRALRENGLSYQKVADVLNNAAIDTKNSTQWCGKKIQTILKREGVTA
jgi:site-specific DNA recombinase